MCLFECVCVCVCVCVWSKLVHERFRACVHVLVRVFASCVCVCCVFMCVSVRVCVSERVCVRLSCVRVSV